MLTADSLLVLEPNKSRQSDPQTGKLKKYLPAGANDIPEKHRQEPFHRDNHSAIVRHFENGHEHGTSAFFSATMSLWMVGAMGWVFQKRKWPQAEVLVLDPNRIQRRCHIPYDLLDSHKQLSPEDVESARAVEPNALSHWILTEIPSESIVKVDSLTMILSKYPLFKFVEAYESVNSLNDTETSMPRKATALYHWYMKFLQNSSTLSWNSTFTELREHVKTLEFQESQGYKPVEVAIQHKLLDRTLKRWFGQADSKALPDGIVGDPELDKANEFGNAPVLLFTISSFPI